MRSGRGTALSMLTAVLLVTSCTGDEDAASTTTAPTTVPVEGTTTTSPTVDTTTTTTTTTPGPPLVSEGDVNEMVAAFQWLLNCGGFGDLTIDGRFGPATGAAVEAAGGDTDEDAFARLSRACPEPRPLSADTPGTVVGYAAPDAPAAYALSLSLGTTLHIVVTDGLGVTVSVIGADGALVEPDTDSTWPIGTTMEYLIRVEAGPEPGTFTLDLEVGEGAPTAADWLLTTNAITYRGTRLALGDPAEETIARIFEFLGHGPRGNLGEFDTGWDFPGQEGFRGILVEGFRFLFYGPNDDFPDRPQTLGRIRVVEPTVDANGDPRPRYYVTTPEGVGVGHTLADLTTVYGTFVRAGSNADEHFYRLVNPRGELCFYFGDTAPTPESVIVEISTECRG
jgi:hypothetical protein